MTSVLAAQNISFSEMPESEIDSNSSEESLYKKAKDKIEKICFLLSSEIPESEPDSDSSEESSYKKAKDKIENFFFLLSDEFINKTINLMSLTIELTDNQNFFLKESVKKLNRTIELDTEYLNEEMVELPTDKVKDTTSQLLRILASKNIFPEKISTSIEGGISLAFDKNSNRLFLEIYNDGDFGYIIEDTFHKKLLENEDLFSLSEASERIENFYK